MEKRVIKKLILEKQFEISQVELIERNIEFDTRANYVIVGIRRAGKSYQIYQNIKQLVSRKVVSIEDCLYVNFEDERIASIKAEELGLLIESYNELFDNPKPFIYLDEIQNIKGWEKFARRLADSKYRVIITGSNAKMLSRDISTTLGGRFIIREVFPFSFPEYLSWNKIVLNNNWEYNSQTRLQVNKLFETYFHFGGFAETFELKQKREWINSLYQKILIGDIIARNNIRNGNAVRLLVKKIAESVMQACSQSRLLHIVKSSGNIIGRNTIAEYLSYIKDAYLSFNVSNFIDSLSERTTTCKRYLYDNGLLNNFLFEGEPLLLENLVAIELVKKYRNGEDDGVYYYNKGIEVDFFIPEEGLAIQVSYSIEDPLTRERETRALSRLAEVFDVKEAIIITRDEEGILEVEKHQIKVIPIWKWLCS